MKPGLVSVVIPTYNQECFVRETVESVLIQTYQDIEILITDDGSTDGTVGIIQEYADRYPEKVTAVLSETNTGIAANLNRALRKVQGEYIAWLGGDDLMLPEKIGKQVNLLQQRPDAVGCCHDADVFQSHDGKILGLFSVLMNGQRKFKEGGVELWFKPNYFMLPSTFMIRSLATPAHGFDGRLKYLNDWLFDVEVFRKGKCVPLNEVLGKYRRHENNVTGRSDARTIGCEEGVVALAILESRYPELGSYIIKKRKIAYLTFAVNSFRNGDMGEAKKYLLLAARNGIVLRGGILFLVLKLFGTYIIRQLALLPYQRSTVFMKLSKYIKM